MKAIIHKSGLKLVLYFPKESTPFQKGELIEMKILKEGKEKSFLTKFNYNIVIRNNFVKELGLKKDAIIKVELKRVICPQKPPETFKENKIDLLTLIPEHTSNSYKIFADCFNRNNEDWLRIWYSHKRGSGRQIEIKRFIDIDSFGRLLGQLQAEGTKSGRRFKLEFCNKTIEEHFDYMKYLEMMGIPKETFIAQLSFHPDVKNIEEIVKKFEEKTQIRVKYIIKAPTSKGSYGFRTYIRNTLFSDIVLSSLDAIRNRLVNKSWNENMKKLADAFFAKVLTGDGTLDIKTKNREYNFPETRIKIVDCNLQYLKDYAEIMKKLGFTPHINEKHISVRAYAGFEKLLYLYKIKAFYNTPNWKKLIWLINENLKGRRLKTNLRFLDILRLKSFTTKNLIENYGIKERSAHDWLSNKVKEGLLSVDKSNKLFGWFPTKKAIELMESLKLFQKDSSQLE